MLQRRRGYLRRPESDENADIAIELFDRALERDPEFALAQAGLGDAYRQKYWDTKEPAWNERALKASQRALVLDDGLAEAAMEAWRSHLEKHYTPEEAVQYLEAWSEEDTYYPISDELDWLRQAGFQADVIWRKDLWAVLLCV